MKNLHIKEVGGALSFCTLNAALLFVLGVTEGGLVLATGILSLLLCPGTPSKIFFSPFAFASKLALPRTLVLTLPVEALGLAGLVGVFGPNLKLAALVILGAITGGAVLAT